MSMSDWLAPSLYGVAVGAVAMTVAGFSWGGWTLGSTARRMADAQSETAVAAALVPVCIDQSKSDPMSAVKLSALSSAKSFERQDLVMKSGWANPPGADKPDMALARACLTALAIKP